MNEININAVKKQLQEFTRSYQRRPRGKFAVLTPLREEILELTRRGATTAEIASILAQYQITVSKDTIGRFLREEAKRERTIRAKKPTSDTQSGSNADASRMLNKPRMMPRVNLVQEQQPSEIGNA